MLWDIWPEIYYKFTAESVLKEFLKSLNCGKHAEKLIASIALCAVALSCWKMKNSLEIWRMIVMNCCNSITLLVNLDSVIDKCQTGVMPCYSPTDVHSDWTLLCARFVTTSLFLVGRSFCGFFDVGCQNCYSNKHPILPVILSKLFQLILLHKSAPPVLATATLFHYQNRMIAFQRPWHVKIFEG